MEVVVVALVVVLGVVVVVTVVVVVDGVVLVEVVDGCLVLPLRTINVGKGAGVVVVFSLNEHNLFAD